MSKRLAGALMMLGAAILMMAGAQGASAAKAKTVEISGRAFIFNHMSTGISNATIKVREFPKLSATTDEFGDYRLRVPDDANVTPYILSGGPAELVRRNMDGEQTGTMTAHWNEIDLQTFHTRGQDIENANFQAPRDEEYNGLKALLQVYAGLETNPETGRPAECVIVTTASARNVRDVDFRTYWLNTPHGVEGATSLEYPAIEGPIYFNESVIPDPSQPYASNDGGIVWPVVPAGTYRIVTSAPDARFASFLATCKPGRIVNANPPMGAYELSPGEKPRTFSNVAAKVTKAKAVRKGKKKRVVNVTLNSGEAIDATVRVKAGKQTVVRKPRLKAGNRTVRIAIKPRNKAKKAHVRVDLKDASGISFRTVKKVAVPKVIKKKAKRPGKRR